MVLGLQQVCTDAVAMPDIVLNRHGALLATVSLLCTCKCLCLCMPGISRSCFLWHSLQRKASEFTPLASCQGHTTPLFCTCLDTLPLLAVQCNSIPGTSKPLAAAGPRFRTGLSKSAVTSPPPAAASAGSSFGGAGAVAGAIPGLSGAGKYRVAGLRRPGGFKVPTFVNKQ